MKYFSRDYLKLNMILENLEGTLFKTFQNLLTKFEQCEIVLNIQPVLIILFKYEKYFQKFLFNILI